ncbi:hypothetical protein [Flexilinea flocculi]|uniref:Lipoprotein n=1 Tax=Flexilinea flocculi TaxID=1678840 RepID=A0A0K8PAG7_9CHLR|nr:hypothetical protein [Flexilinea flocculi]GAP39519.1 hypothetical protein ATC1_1249 [Flexilinea flocculi]
MAKRKSIHFDFILVFVAILAIMLAGCGKKDTDGQATGDASTKVDTEESVSVSQEAVVEEKNFLSVYTNISYSAGNDSDWSYGNQRKEFPNNDACYVRIGSTAITNGLLEKGVDDEITVTYRFTGTEKCKVEISDGKATKTETNDPNVVEFTRVINAAKEKAAKENLMIFRYTPNGAESMALEVIYDDQIAEKYDELNTVYFVKESDSENGTD